MAYIGMLHPVVAKIETETEGQAVTYAAGMVMGKAISGNLTWDRMDNPLYADDSLAEDDNSLTGGTLELGTDDLLDSVRSYVLGLEAMPNSPSATDAPTEYETTDEAAPNVGCGYIRVRRKNGRTSYQAIWFHKVQFGETNENSQTKGQNIEWQTPTLTGRIMGVRNDATGKARYRRHVTFETLSDALNWLNTKAGITAQAGG